MNGIRFGVWEMVEGRFVRSLKYLKVILFFIGGVDDFCLFLGCM